MTSNTSGKLKRTQIVAKYEYYFHKHQSFVTILKESGKTKPINSSSFTFVVHVIIKISKMSMKTVKCAYPFS